MVLAIVYNIALLLSLGLLYSLLPYKELKKNIYIQILTGFVIGLAGFFIMAKPVVFQHGINYDSRSILLAVSGMFFGLLPTFVATLLLTIYRVIIGGSGLVGGLAVMICSSLIGIGWHQLRLKRVMNMSWSRALLEFFLVGLAVHLAMFATTFLIQVENLPEILRFILPSLLIAYPVGTSLLALMLYNQQKGYEKTKLLIASEQRFKRVFDAAPIGISLSDVDTCQIVAINDAFEKMLKTPKEALLKMNWMDLTHDDDMKLFHHIIAQLKEQEGSIYTTERHLLAADGSHVWIELALTLVRIGENLEQQVLCMANDFSQRKAMEERLNYANIHDSLTGLYNRNHFENYVRTLKNPAQFPLIVAFGDINSLSVINEAFGRREGDRLLTFTAETISRHLAQGDFVARVGGDEFSIILANKTEDEIDHLFNQISQSMAQEKFGKAVQGSITFGYQMVHSHEEDLNEAIRRAEADVVRQKMFSSPTSSGKTITAIIHTLFIKNRREELHSQRVSSLCYRLARALNLSNREAIELRTAGLMHDIGKIAIDEAILNKQEELEESEWKRMREHSAIGYRILGSVSEMAHLADFVLCHHERLDGSGYPNALKGDEIPLQARIIAIADAYDAMTSERTYRARLTKKEAIAELKRCSGTQFDANLVEVFIEKVLPEEI